MFYIIGLALILTLCMFIKHPKSLYSIIFSMELIAVVLILYSDIMLKIKLGNCTYGNQMEFVLYKTLYRIQIGYFDIKNIINFSLFIFSLSSLLLFEHDLKHKKNKIVHIFASAVFILFFTAITMVLNSPNFGEKIYISRYLNNSAIFQVLSGLSPVLNKLIIIICILPCIKIVWQMKKTRIIFIKNQLHMLFMISLIIYILFAMIITFLSVNDVISNFNIYDFSFPEITSSMSETTLNLILMFTILLLAVMLFMHFDVLSERLFKTRYPNPDKAIILVKDIRHIFHSYKNALFSVKTKTQTAINNFGTQKSLDTLNNISSEIDVFIQKASKFLNIYNHVPLSYNCADIVRCIDEACKQVNYSESIKIIRKIPSDNFDFYGDSDLMTEVFVNLLSNSIESIKKKNIADGIIVIEIWTESPWICISIKDNGIGITKKNQKKMFSPFFSTKQTFENWGVGLAYTKNIVQAHSGYINLKSVPNSFTEFQIIIPHETDE